MSVGSVHSQYEVVVGRYSDMTKPQTRCRHAWRGWRWRPEKGKWTRSCRRCSKVASSRKPPVAVARTKGDLVIRSADGSKRVVAAHVATGMARRTVVGKKVEFKQAG